MPTRQTSSSGRPKSPRIQVVLPEELCDRLAVLADLEARTVSNMARVLIQQGVERLERLQEMGPDEPPTAAPAQRSQSARPSPQAPLSRESGQGSGAGRFGAAAPGSERPRGDLSRRGTSSSERTRSRSSRASRLSADQFRAELERQGQEPPSRTQRPRRLRIWRPG